MAGNPHKKEEGIGIASDVGEDPVIPRFSKGEQGEEVRW